LTSPWRVETVSGLAAHLLDPPAITERAVRFLIPEDRAVVMGSTQPEAHIDRVRADAMGISVVRRRGGGAAVLVGPGQVLWTDVVIPAEDPLWTADVGRAFWWLGDVWSAALGAVGLEGAQAWRLGLRHSPWSDRVCFAGLGPGEVTLGDSKVVGISQRRTRAGAHFQCAVPLLWNPSELLALMALDRDTRQEATTQLADVALGVGADVGSQLMVAFPDRLP
jgi:lipoate---protein ligase